MPGAAIKEFLFRQTWADVVPPPAQKPGGASVRGTYTPPFRPRIRIQAILVSQVPALSLSVSIQRAPASTVVSCDLSAAPSGLVSLVSYRAAQRISCSIETHAPVAVLTSEVSFDHSLSKKIWDRFAEIEEELIASLL